MKVPARDVSASAFAAALDALVPQLRQDRSILAAILGGSLSHDKVWAKSDIDLLLVTADDTLAGPPYVSLYADGLNVHAQVMQRAAFRKMVEGAVHQSFMHSFLAKSRVLFTHDDTIADLCARLQSIGERDTRLALLEAGTSALPCLYKAHKFLVTRGDLDYTALWILYAATPLAQVEVIAARKLVDREVIPQALELNPTFFKTIYTVLHNSKKTRKSVEVALAAVDDHVRDGGGQDPALLRRGSVGRERGSHRLDAPAQLRQREQLLRAVTLVEAPPDHPGVEDVPPPPRLDGDADPSARRGQPHRLQHPDRLARDAA
jgi:hypothetical protein